MPHEENQVAPDMPDDDRAELGLDVPLSGRVVHPPEPRVKRPVKAKPSKAEPTSAAPDGRPKLRLDTEQRHHVLAAIAVLAELEPALYQRAGRLVHVVDEAERGARSIAPVKSARLATMIAERCSVFGRSKQGEWVRAHPPRWLVDGILAEDAWPDVRVLRGVTGVPFLRADGTLVTTPGYDLRSRMLYEPTVEVPSIPESPTIDDARQAVARLHDVLRDFPFRAAADRSVALSALLAYLGRSAIRGPVPMHIIEANVRGAGKSLLCDVIVSIALGRPAARITACSTEDEWRKRILAVVLEATPIALIDNVRGTLASASLEALLTSTAYADRLLGSSTTATAHDVQTMWLATANNAVLGGDLGRRSLLARLDSPHEHPEERTDLHRPEGELRALLRDRRGELVAAGLTILRAWFAVGRPAPPAPIRGMGSFPEYDAIVRHALLWVGEADPGDVIPELRERADADAGHLRSVLAAWRAVYGDRWATAGDVVRHCWPSSGAEPLDPDGRALRDDLAEWAARGRPIPTAGSLGMRLRAARGRIAGGLVVESRPGRSRQTEWRVVPPTRPADTPSTGEAGDAGESGTTPRGRAGAGAHARDHARAYTRAGARACAGAGESAVADSPGPPPSPEHSASCSCGACRTAAAATARQRLAEGGDPFAEPDTFDFYDEGSR